MVIITMQLDGNYYHKFFSHEIGQLLFEKTYFSHSMKWEKITSEKNDTLAIV